MPWTERQRALLEAMGLRLWLPPASAEGAESAEGAQAAVSMEAVAATGRPAAAVAATAAATAAEATTAATSQATGGATRFRPAASVVMPIPPAAAPSREGVVAAASNPAHRPSVPAPAPMTMTTDWATLRETVAGCTACRLCESRRQTVFGVGHERAHWMIVGEAPGEQEDRQGEPFVGKSGQLLDNMLRAIGLSRTASDDAGAAAGGDPARQVYICNTLKCRPPGNRNPEPDELARCEAYLIRQIQLVQPRVILAMGRFAVQGLLRSSEPIGRLRGRVHHYEGVPLIVTYHPAYLLRNCDEKAKAWDDLCLALETVQAADPIAARAPARVSAPAGRPVSV